MDPIWNCTGMDQGHPITVPSSFPMLLDDRVMAPYTLINTFKGGFMNNRKSISFDV